MIGAVRFPSAESCTARQRDKAAIRYRSWSVAAFRIIVETPPSFIPASHTNATVSFFVSEDLSGAGPFVLP